MKCPKCGTSWICVLESRHTTSEVISRRRQCKACDHVFATAEVVVPDDQWGWAEKPRKQGKPRSEFGVKAAMLSKLTA